jgi:hypothetical protein
MKYTADLKVTFVIEDGQPEDHATRILYREVAQFEHAIEHGRWPENTGVEKGSVKVQILTHGPTIRPPRRRSLWSWGSKGFQAALNAVWLLRR